MTTRANDDRKTTNTIRNPRLITEPLQQPTRPPIIRHRIPPAPLTFNRDMHQNVRGQSECRRLLGELEAVSCCGVLCFLGGVVYGGCEVGEGDEEYCRRAKRALDSSQPDTTPCSGSPRSTSAGFNISSNSFIGGHNANTGVTSSPFLLTCPAIQPLGHKTSSKPLSSPISSSASLTAVSTGPASFASARPPGSATSEGNVLSLELRTVKRMWSSAFGEE